MENKLSGHCFQDTPGTSLIKQKEKRFQNSEKQEISALSVTHHSVIYQKSKGTFIYQY